MSDFPETIFRYSNSSPRETLNGFPYRFIANGFKMEKSLSSYTVKSNRKENVVSAAAQHKNYMKLVTSDLGALVYLCGDYERARLWAYNYCHYVTGPRYGFRINPDRIRWITMPRTIHKDNLSSGRLQILDGLFAYRVDDRLQTDYTRADTLREVISNCRRDESTVLVLCPKINPQEAQNILHHEYDIALNFKQAPQRF